MNLRKNLNKGEVIFHEGNPSNNAYIIGLGSIEILENTGNGQKVMGVLGENEIFGEMGLIDGLPRSATARAREDSVVYVLTPQTFDALVQENPEALLPILKILISRLRETMKHLKLGYKFSAQTDVTPLSNFE
ncbi:MAG: cyclic nucleotide-binding domain-containing protein [Nitrospina sp.]|jgi:CRP-like cAMP-binding protein|nr:cyclic nucleotide-binding domain-containing protein [Nitrospina sp.]